MNKNKILTFLTILFLFISSLDLVGQIKKDGPVRVFITAGQSNTDGRVNNKLLPDYIKSLATDTTEYNEGEYEFCKIVQNNSSGFFVPYWPKGRITNGLWTYDAVTYYLIEQAIQENFYVIKWAVGGTSIAYPNDTTRGRYWSAYPEWLSQTTSVEKGGKSLLLSFTDAIDAAIDNTLSKIESGYKIDAFLWHQGESDARYAEDYYGNLRSVIAHVRHHLTKRTGDDYSQLPFVFGSIPESNRHYRPVLEAAMKRISEEDPNAFLIDISKEELQRDRTHFNEKSAEYLGKQMFKILDRILNLSGNRFRVAKYRDDKDCAISYTFDDGLKEHYTLITPKFRELGFKGTFWINGNSVNLDANNIKDTTRVTWENLKEMAKLGHEISNHGWSHKNFRRHTQEEIKEDIFRNDSAIFNNIGIMPRTFCYPHNTKTPEGVMIASENRVGTRLLQRSVGGKATHENLEQWVNGLLNSNGWGVAMTHGITYGYDRFSSTDIFWEHLQKVKEQEDRIWVGTFQEVSAYMKGWKSITYDVKEKENGFIVTPYLTLNNSLFTELLTGVIDQPNIKKATIHQAGKELKAQVLSDKALFDFDPFGGEVDIEIENNESSAAGDLFPDRTPVPDWFRENEPTNINNLGKHYKITDYGVSLDSTLIQTKKIQSVIDLAYENGGGVIIIPPGVYLSGSLFFKPNTHLHLEQDATLKGSDDISHFELTETRIEGQNIKYFSALINVDNVNGFTISGKGTLNGNGLRYWKSFWLRRGFNPQCTNLDEMRPRLLYVSNSKDVKVSGIRLINSPFWTSHFYKCENLKLLDLYFFAPHTGVKAPSSDAIDLDVCRNVLIKNCYVSVNDDAVALKGGKGPFANQEDNNGGNYNIIIEDCDFGFCHSALTFGSESVYNRNIILRRVKVNNSRSLLLFKMRPDTPQHFEHILIEEVEGSAKSVFSVNSWTQFFDLKGEEDVRLGFGNNVILRNIVLKTDHIFNIKDSDQYVLSEIRAENIHVLSKNDQNISLDFINNLITKNIFVNSKILPNTISFKQQNTY